MTICYFTASGNCLYVARRIGGTLLSIPQLMRQETIEIEDDAVGIVCPVYAVEMPMMVREFMARAKIRTDYFFFIYTYGMGYAEAFSHAELAAEKVGLTLSYIGAVQMADNYLPIFDMQEQIDTLPQKNVEGQIEQICRDVAERKIQKSWSLLRRRPSWQSTRRGWRITFCGRKPRRNISLMTAASSAGSAQKSVWQTTFP